MWNKRPTFSDQLAPGLEDIRFTGARRLELLRRWCEADLPHFPVCVAFPAMELSSGEEHHTEILIPQAFTYLLTKLCAFRDWMHDADRSLGQHHALDIYRIVAMLTREEDADVRCLSQEFSEHTIVVDARQIAAAHFTSQDGLGLLRIQEHALYQTAMDLRRISEELDLLLGTGTPAARSDRQG